jgi:Ser/Thr protein kinase RdoA (MazF antagonist)
MSHLADRGLPVPRVLPAADGRWHISAGDSNFVLLEYRPGAPYGGSTEHIDAAAATLARMHLAAGDGDALDISPDAPRESAAAIVAEHFDLARAIRPLSAGAASSFDGLRELAASTLATAPTGPSVAVHGDFIPWNLAFGSAGGSESKVAAVHDFDNACVDTPLHDIGEALASFFLVPHARMTAILRPVPAHPQLPVREIGRFLRRYGEVRPLSEDDLQGLRLVTLANWWESVLLSYIRGDQSEECFPIMTTYPRVLDDAWGEVLDFEGVSR